MTRSLSHKWARSVAALLVTNLALWLVFCISCDDGNSPFSEALDEMNDAVSQIQLAAATIALPKMRTSWHIAAEPYQLEGEEYARGRLLWHTPRYLVAYEDVYDAEAPLGEGILRTLRFVFRPIGSGTKSWAGVTTCFDRAIPDSIDYLDIRLRGDRGLIHLDLGRVDEDVDGDGVADTEDWDMNGAVDEYEDMGLDGIADGQGEIPSDWGTVDDLAGDNWFFIGEGECPFGNYCDTIDWDSDEWFYEFLNGTEGNRRDPPAAGIPDAECLCEGQSLTVSDVCFTWSVDLSGDDFLVEGSEFNGWRTLRLPLRDPLAVDTVQQTAADPSWTDIRHARIWIEADESQTTPDTVEIADWIFISSEG